MAGELANYATSSSVTSAISSALSNYDDSSQVDSKIITALLDFYTRSEVDQQISSALGNVHLSNYYTQTETQSYVASELLAFYPRTELDSQLTATFLQLLDQLANPDRDRRRRRRRGLPDPSAGRHVLLRGQRQRKASSPWCAPTMIKALLPRAPLGASTILSDTALELTPATHHQGGSGRALPEQQQLRAARRQVFPEQPVGGRGHLVQEQFTPHFIRSLLFRPPLTGGAILGNGSVIEIEADCWSKAQSDGRYPLVATFYSLGSTVTSIDGRVTALEASPVPADISCTSLTASSFLETPELRGTPIVLRAIDNTPLASFAAAGVTLDRMSPFNAARTLNATTADFAQLLAGSVAASGNVTTNGSILADQQIESDLRLRAPLLESDPAGFFLTLRGGTQGVLVDDTFGSTGPSHPRPACPS